MHLATMRAGNVLMPVHARPTSVDEAWERVTCLERAYARAVQRLLARGRPLANERLVSPVDAARERAWMVVAEWRGGKKPESAAVQEYASLLRLMEALIEESHAEE